MKWFRKFNIGYPLERRRWRQRYDKAASSRFDRDRWVILPYRAPDTNIAAAASRRFQLLNSIFSC